MRPAGAEKRGGYICGCGRTITVFVPGRLAYQPGQCTWVGKFGACDQQGQFGVPLCAIHIRAVITDMNDGRLGRDIRNAAIQLREDLKSDELKAAEAERRRMEREGRSYASLRHHVNKKAIEGGAVVYYVRFGTDKVKIGTTIQLDQRMSALVVAPEDLLAAEPGSYEVEKARHHEFKADCLKAKGGGPGARELFRLSPTLETHIQAIRKQHGEPRELVARLRRDTHARLREEHKDKPIWNDQRGIVA